MLWNLCAQVSPVHIRERWERRNWGSTKDRGDQWTCCPPRVLIYFSPLPNPICFSIDRSMQSWKGSAFLYSVRPLALSLSCPESGRAPVGYSLSMSLYFFLSMDTWSLNRTGSSLIWEWTRGMVPNQLANLFMQVWRWAKWSGSAQRDARELCGWRDSMRVSEGGGW